MKATTPYTVQTLRDLAENVTPWPESEAKRIRAMAFQSMARHDHDEPLTRIKDKAERQLVWENCGTCVLSRAGRDPLNPKERPNYAGWIRIYVERGEAIPEAWLDADLQESDNAGYFNALLRSVKTFGIHKASAKDTPRYTYATWRPDFGDID